MSLSMEENRAPMNPFQTLRLFIQYVIHLSGHRNKNSRETHQENRQEHIQETTQKKYIQAPRPTRQSCERPRDLKQKVIEPTAPVFAQATTWKLHVILSETQKQNQLMVTVLLRQSRN
ncbi:hypothetical protein MTO96_006318 [Rhipicephalus appendiculatus]